MWPDVAASDHYNFPGYILDRDHLESPGAHYKGPGEKTFDRLPQVRQAPQAQSPRACPEGQGHAVLTQVGEWAQVWQVHGLGRNSKAAYFLLSSGVMKISSFSMPWYPRLSVGFELLRKMGWKEGQGIGPRVKRRPRRQKPGMYVDCH